MDDELLERPCIMKFLYDKATPYIQIIGWLVIAIPIVYNASTYLHATLAYGDDITALKKSDVAKATIIQRMDYNIQIIARKVGVTPLEPSPEERNGQ